MENLLYLLKVYVLFAHVFSPVNSDPPVVVGGDQLRVTLLLEIFVTRTFRGHEGGAKESFNYNLHSTHVSCHINRVHIKFYLLQLYHGKYRIQPTKTRNLLLTTIILFDGNMPSSAYMLFSVSFIISEQKQKQKQMR